VGPATRGMVRVHREESAVAVGLPCQLRLTLKGEPLTFRSRGFTARRAPWTRQRLQRRFGAAR
jgi:hypothetical protein